jgi:hypothetical protein
MPFSVFITSIEACKYVPLPFAFRNLPTVGMQKSDIGCSQTPQLSLLTATNTGDHLYQSARLFMSAHALALLCRLQKETKSRLVLMRCCGFTVETFYDCNLRHCGL